MSHPYHRIVLFGDSITQFSFDPELSGFGAGLAHSYQRRMDVMNRGFSGYNTKWALPILRQLLPTVEQQKQHASQVQLMTIFFGANDAALPFSDQHVPLEEYKENLRKMISMIKSPDSPYYNPTTRLILITPPPLDESQWEKHCDGPLNRTFESAKQYAAAVRQVAKECNVVVADLWTMLVEESGETPFGEYLNDGLHLSAKGNRAVHQLLLKMIKEHFNDIHPDNLGMEIPWWRDLSRTDYEQELQFPLLK
ncbi:hypothetical protein LRAMOSA05869 [Lichtheimia ramosa]|uniref:SGNH hydrolase-type esterase domain-containing protein n=1 Tax=Lichtheimia ramosa TaxID=688394 RepID=A0A077X2A1_9FUNG|nr:hypothetical protein LRAMOSA05869 [Lichtheimia ramosa]